MIIVKSELRKILREQDKRITQEAIGTLNRQVEELVLSACRLTGKFKTITPTEMLLAKPSAK